MQKILFKISVLFLAVFGLFMAIQAVTGRAQAPADQTTQEAAALQIPDYCAEQYTDPTTNATVNPIYNKTDLGTEDMITLYHKTMNDQFNAYIKTMIEHESAAAASGELDPEGVPPSLDPDTNIPLPCDEANYSTYCVAQKLLTNPEWGYMAYQKALDCRRGQMFDSSQQEDLWNQWVQTSACLAGVESVLPPDKCTEDEKAKLQQQLNDTYQAQKALEISARLEALTREKQDAKSALDETLSAYDELRTAWPMHKKYMAIYQSLLKFRDKMVEIRHQVEMFPSKFIDATTTKCT